MATKNKAAGRSSAARRRAARLRDAELAATAIAMLETPGIGDRIASLVATPRLLTYSLRNQALLLSQADERGIALTDVDTYRGWQRRGRQVRAGEHGLKIVRPVRPRGPSEGAEAADQPETDAEENSDIRFRTISVFDRAQTDEIHDPDDLMQTEPGERHGDEPFSGSAAQHHTGSPDQPPPQALLVESLRDQAERAGYLAVITPAHQGETGSVTVDHEGRTIIVYNDGDRQTLSQFAGAVAAVVAAHANATTHIKGPNPR